MSESSSVEAEDTGLSSDVAGAGQKATPDEVERSLHDAQQHCVALYAQVQQLEQSRRDLQATVERYRGTYDQSPVASCTVDVHGRVTAANLTAATCFGVSRDALLGKQLWSLVSPNDRNAVRGQLGRCVESKSRLTGYLRLRVSTIGQVDYQLITTPDASVDGTAAGCRVALVDVSSLALSERRFRDLAQVSSTMSASFDFEQNLAGAVELLAAGAADLAFVDIYEGAEVRRVSAGGADSSTRAVAEALRRLPLARGTAHGSALQNHDAAQALAAFAGTDQASLAQSSGARSLVSVGLGDSDQPHGLLVLVTTQSDRRYSGADVAFAKGVAGRLDAALVSVRAYRDTEHALDNLRDGVPAVAHELGLPVRAIRAATGLGPVDHAAEHLEGLLVDLADPAALERGDFTLTQAPVDLAPLVALAVELVAPNVAAKELTLDVDVRRLLVTADPRRVVQVVANVLLEVIEATPIGGTVSIGAAARPGTVHAGQHQLTVRAQQAVLPKELLFELLQQSWAPRAGAARPVGRGLDVAKHLVEAHGGAIWMESLPNQGAAFHFTLPVADDVR